MATPQLIDELFDFIYPLAQRAGEILLEGYAEVDKKVNTKLALYDVVTDYDNKIEEFLIKQILARYPEHKFIGEEDTAKNNHVTKALTDAPTWIIDPIDGTANFIKQIPHVGVSIGLSVNKQIVLGIINNPVLKKMYTAKLGGGAFCNGKPIHVSNVTKLSEAQVSCEMLLFFDLEVRNKFIKRMYHIGANARRLLAFGSIVDPLAMVASGNLDAFHVANMYPWDCAAGYLIVREAGGVATNPNGGPFDIMKPDLICAATEQLRKELEGFIRKADQAKSVGGEE